jgi:hypothetical protein
MQVLDQKKSSSGGNTAKLESMFKDKLKTAVSQSLLGMQAELLAKMKDTEKVNKEIK